MTNVVAQFNRPADTTAYAAGDLVAPNPATPMQFDLPAWTGQQAILRARLFKSTTALTGAAFRLWLWLGAVAPVAVNPDNGAFSFNGANDAFAAIDFSAPVLTASGANPFTDGTRFEGLPVTGLAPLLWHLNGSSPPKLFGALEARGAYAPGNAELFRVALELTATN